MDTLTALKHVAQRREDRTLQWEALSVLSEFDSKFVEQLLNEIFRRPRDEHERSLAHLVAARLALSRSNPNDAHRHLGLATDIPWVAPVYFEQLAREIANALQESAHNAEAINLRTSVSGQSSQWCVDELRDACALLEIDELKGRVALNAAYKNALHEVAKYYELEGPSSSEIDLWSVDYDPGLDAVLTAALTRSAEWWAKDQRFTDCEGMACVFDAFLEIGRRSKARRPTMILAIETFQDLNDGDEDELEEFGHRLEALKAAG